MALCGGLRSMGTRSGRVCSVGWGLYRSKKPMLRRPPVLVWFIRCERWLCSQSLSSIRPRITSKSKRTTKMKIWINVALLVPVTALRALPVAVQEAEDPSSLSTTMSLWFPFPSTKSTRIAFEVACGATDESSAAWQLGIRSSIKQKGGIHQRSSKMKGSSRCQQGRGSTLCISSVSCARRCSRSHFTEEKDAIIDKTVRYQIGWYPSLLIWCFWKAPIKFYRAIYVKIALPPIRLYTYYADAHERLSWIVIKALAMHLHLFKFWRRACDMLGLNYIINTHTFIHHFAYFPVD